MRERIEKVKSRTPAVPTGYTGRKVQTMRGLTRRIRLAWQREPETSQRSTASADRDLLIVGAVCGLERP